MDDPIITVTTDQLICIVGQKEVERLMLIQLLAQANKIIAELTPKEPAQGDTQ